MRLKKDIPSGILRILIEKNMDELLHAQGLSYPKIITNCFYFTLACKLCVCVYVCVCVCVCVWLCAPVPVPISVSMSISVFGLCLFVCVCVCECV